ncbi:MAG: 3-deoxy-D-manno-octulosonic acid transferase [Bacteroidales bacterium]|nr:3-deoxy-D-manno-octulosonic acid transferase [Bacteroidales bacterium]
MAGKIKLFLDGRRNLFKRMEAAIAGAENIVWFHTASYGEFEEARPVIEATRREHPEYRILLTFFSPSGYEPRKNWPGADWVFYLPLDTKRNARRFLDIVRPVKAVFTIGEFWLNFLGELRKRRIDTYIMSVRVTPDSAYMKWYGHPYRKAFRSSYKCMLVQKEETAELLRGIGVPDVRITGDPRLDRVLAIKEEDWNEPLVEKWLGGQKAFVAGSTCPKEDDDVCIELVNAHPGDKFLYVPHETDIEPIKDIISRINGRCVLYSEADKTEDIEDAQVLIIDKVGMLARLYRYGWAAFVGAGFITDEPHSVIEPAAYGLPVATGPHYGHNLHMVELVRLGAARGISDGKEICNWYDEMKNDPALLEKRSRTASDYCASGRGATDAIMKVIFQ